MTYYVESWSAWFVCNAPNKRAAYHEGVETWGRGLVKSVRRASKDEVEYYNALKSGTPPPDQKTGREPLTVTMARGTTEDVDALNAFLTEVELYNEDAWEEDVMERPRPTPEDLLQQLPGGWRRVVWGYDTLLQLTDPQKYSLDLSPTLKRAIGAYLRENVIDVDDKPVPRALTYEDFQAVVRRVAENAGVILSGIPGDYSEWHPERFRVIMCHVDNDGHQVTGVSRVFQQMQDQPFLDGLDTVRLPIHITYAVIRENSSEEGTIQELWRHLNFCE